MVFSLDVYIVILWNVSRRAAGLAIESLRVSRILCQQASKAKAGHLERASGALKIDNRTKQCASEPILVALRIQNTRFNQASG